jgi:hypothetical protein
MCFKFAIQDFVQENRQKGNIDGFTDGVTDRLAPVGKVVKIVILTRHGKCKTNADCKNGS